MSKSQASSRYLASKSYQSCPRTSRISAGTLAAGRPSASSSTPHSISRPVTAASISTLESCSKAIVEARRQLVPATYLGDADAGAGAGRLDEHRQPEVADVRGMTPARRGARPT